MSHTHKKIDQFSNSCCLLKSNRYFLLNYITLEYFAALQFSTISKKHLLSFKTQTNLENYNTTKLIHFLTVHEQHACSNYRKRNYHKRADYQLRCCQSNSERRATVIHVAAQSYLPIQLANNPGKHFEVNIVPTVYLHSRKKAL